MKLWNKGFEIDQLIEDYTVGMDPILDLKLVPFDCIASLAHARMLQKMGILNEDEFQSIARALKEISDLAEKGDFVITKDQEDCHTAIENFLTQKLGDVGKKIHTARSRNDQVLVAFRLFSKAQLEILSTQIVELKSTITHFLERHRDVILPGFTHTRKAMPMPLTMWGEGLIDSMLDNLGQIKGLNELLDQSPLGTGAGFGIPLELDRDQTAKELGFSRVQNNPVYAQNSRAKFDAAILSTLSFIMYDLNKYCSDLIWFTLPDLGYFELPESFVTGSSIMPQKRNPDILELIRSNYHVLVAKELQAKSMGSNLISGYHRDFQLLKEPVMTGFQILQDSLQVFNLVFSGMKVQKGNCQKALTEDLFATKKVYDLVRQGIPFRDAYRTIASEIGGTQNHE